MTYLISGVGFLADLLTVILGIAAIWGLLFRRQQLEAVFQLALITYRSQRLNRVRITIGRLEHLNYDTKESRAEIRALLGQLSGELTVLSTEFPQLADISKKLTEQAMPNRRWTEAAKRKLVSEASGVLEQLMFAEQVATTERHHHV